MFDKIKFAQILKDISETYNSQREFSEKANINRTYISKYINMKIANPPTPKILEKLADSSNDIISYVELMVVCGYIQDEKIIANVNKLKKAQEFLNKYLEELNLTELEEKYYKDFFLKACDMVISKQFDKDKALSNIEIEIKKIDNKNISTYKILEAIKANINFLILESNLKELDEVLKNKKSSSFDDSPQVYLCPVYGKIKAGEPNWAEQNIEGRIAVPITPENTHPEECFYLLVDGNSMNKIVKNGDYALIHKQDYAEDGDYIVALVNGYDATLKKYKRLNKQFVLLEPVSDDINMESITVDLKSTEFQILGKMIAHFGYTR